MGIISLSYNPSGGDTRSISSLLGNFTTIVSEVNGNLDNANIKSGANIATSKLADDAGITAAKLGASAVTSAKIADGAATSAKIAPTILHAAATNDLTITDPLTDVPGATLTFTPAVASRLLITAVFDIRIERNVFTYGEFCRTAGRIVLDGSVIGTYARFAVENDGSQTPRVDAEACVACQAVVNVTAASHTVKLQAELEAGPWTGTATARSGHTALSILVVSQ